MKNKRIVFLTTLIIMFIIPFFQFDPTFSNIDLTSEEQEWIKNHPVITLSPDPIFYPIEFLDEKNNYNGFAADYINWIQNETGLNIEIEISENWSEVIEKMQNKKIDLIGAAVKTNDRSNYMIFTEPIISVQNIIIGKDNISSDILLEDMDGFNVAVVKDYAINDYITEKYPKIELIQVNSSEEGLKRVSFGMSDLFIGDSIQISSNMDDLELTNLKFINETEFTYNLSFAIRNDYTILQSILNKALLAMPKKEKDLIYDKWIKIKPFDKKREIIIFKLAVFLTIIVIIAFINNLFLSNRVKEKTKELENSNSKLENLNNDLDKLVEKRTIELSENIKKLTEAKDQLAEAKKMASLNELIIGLSNELDSPISNLKTIVSFMQINNNSFENKINNNTLSKDFLIKHFDFLKENTNLLNSSIIKADNLNTTLKSLKLHQELNKNDFVTLNSLIAELKKEYLFKYRNVNMNLIINVKNKGENIMVPEYQIAFIAKELINNSLFHAYSESNTYEIVLNFIVTKENLIISVKDYGKGIPKEYIDKIFNPFFTTTRQRGSIGLGLFIVYLTIRNILKGQINLESSNKGTTFKITLPLKICSLSQNNK